jgi:hypothetical protein
MGGAIYSMAGHAVAVVDDDSLVLSLADSTEDALAAKVMENSQSSGLCGGYGHGLTRQWVQEAWSGPTRTAGS